MGTGLSCALWLNMIPVVALHLTSDHNDGAGNANYTDPSGSGGWTETAEGDRTAKEDVSAAAEGQAESETSSA